MGIARNAVVISHEIVKNIINEGDIVIDATAGKGNDTLLLANLVGDSGHVYSFDIQQEALNITRQKLQKEELLDRVTLICDGHENLDQYISTSVKLVMFNLGYLPGGDHSIHTHWKTTIQAIEKGLNLLPCKGIIVLVVYHGGDSGFEEKDEVMDFVKTLDHQKYSVLVHEFVNRINYPPIAVCIEKIK